MRDPKKRLDERVRDLESREASERKAQVDRAVREREFLERFSSWQRDAAEAGLREAAAKCQGLDLVAVHVRHQDNESRLVVSKGEKERWRLSFVADGENQQVGVHQVPLTDPDRMLSATRHPWRTHRLEELTVEQVHDYAAGFLEAKLD